MFTINDPYEKKSFDEMSDGSYFEFEGKVYQKVKWEGESSYVLDCAESLIMSPNKLGQGEYRILIMDPNSNVEFRHVISS